LTKISDTTEGIVEP